MSATATSSKRTRSAKSSSVTTATSTADVAADDSVSPPRQSKRQRKLSTSLLSDDEAEQGIKQNAVASGLPAQRRSKRHGSVTLVADHQSDGETKQDGEQRSTASSSSMQLRTRRSSKQTPSTAQNGVHVESNSSDESDVGEQNNGDVNDHGATATSSSSSSSSSSSGMRKVEKGEQKRIDKWQAVQTAATEITDWVAQQLQEHHIEQEFQVRALAAVQKPLDEMLQQATNERVFNFDMLDPLTLKGLLMSVIGVDADRLEWKDTIRTLCHNLTNKGRQYAKLMTPSAPFKRPTVDQLKQLDNAAAQPMSGDADSYDHLKPLIALLTPVELCNLRSVDHYWRRVVNSFSEWPVALTLPVTRINDYTPAYYASLDADKVLKMVASIPQGSLRAVRTLVLGNSDFYITQIQTRTLLWDIRQVAPCTERIAILDLRRNISVELPILLSFPRLHSFALHESHRHWSSQYKEHEGRIAPQPKWPGAEQAGNAVDGETQPKSSEATNETDKAPKLADKQWQQLKEKCTVWFKHTSGGDEKAINAAANFAQYVDPDADRVE